MRRCCCQLGVRCRQRSWALCHVFAERSRYHTYATLVPAKQRRDAAHSSRSRYYSASNPVTQRADSLVPEGNCLVAVLADPTHALLLHDGDGAGRVAVFEGWC